MPDKFLLLPPLFVLGGKYQGASGQWPDHLASAAAAQKVANIWKSGEYLRRTSRKSNHNRPVGWQMKTTQINDVIIYIHLDGYSHQNKTYIFYVVQFFGQALMAFMEWVIWRNGSLNYHWQAWNANHSCRKTSGWILCHRYLLFTTKHVENFTTRTCPEFGSKSNF